MQTSFFKKYLAALGVKDSERISPDAWIDRTFLEHLFADFPAGSSQVPYRPVPRTLGDAPAANAFTPTQPRRQGIFAGMLSRVAKDLTDNYFSEENDDEKSIAIHNAIATYVAIVAFSAPDKKGEVAARNLARAKTKFFQEIAAATSLNVEYVKQFGCNAPFVPEAGDHTLEKRLELLTEQMMHELTNTAVRYVRNTESYRA